MKLQNHISNSLLFLINSSNYNIDKSSHNFIINLCHQHNIIPTVYENLKNISDYNYLVDKLKIEYLKNSQKNIIMSAELLRINSIFEKSNIESLSIKGSSLAVIAYGDITKRQYSDLDIVIKYEDREKIYDILSQEGYEKVFNLTPIQEYHWYRQSKDMLLYHTQKGIHIELHWLLLDRDYPVNIDMKSIWETKQSIVINHKNIYTFSNEKLLIYLLIHGSKHLYQKIGWIKDIDKLISSVDIDWSIIDKEIETHRYRRFLILGLYLSYEMFDTNIPSYYSKRFEDRWLNKVSKFIVNNWQKSQNMFANTIASSYLFETFRDKISYIHKTIIKPSRKEYSFVDLPKYLFWFYYIIRPYLLIKKYIFR